MLDSLDKSEIDEDLILLGVITIRSFLFDLICKWKSINNSLHYINSRLQEMMKRKVC
jgi:hypothetical protein